MRSRRSTFVLPLALALGGCPTAVGVVDAGVVAPDAGPAVDAGLDAGVVDAGFDAGMDMDAGFDAGMDMDAGPDAGMEMDAGMGCVAANPCEGVAVSRALSLQPGAAPTVTAGAVTLTLGTSTRADADGALGPATTVGSNPFVVAYCEAGVLVQFADDVAGDTFNGAADAADIVARVTASNAMTTASGVAIGATRAAGVAALGMPTTSHPVTDASGTRTWEYHGAQGFGWVVAADQSIASMFLYKPQDNTDRWGGTVDFNAGTLTTASGTLTAGRPLLGGSAFSTVDGALGTGFDVEGETELTARGQTVDVFVRSYVALGVRVAGVCSPFSGCSGSTKVSSLVLSSPFRGTTATGLGLGSTPAAFEAELGAGTLDVNMETGAETTIYTAGSKTVQVSFSGCPERASAVIIYEDPS